MLKKLFRYLTPLALSYWIGSMLFFSFVLAPRVFKVLEREDAATLQTALFYPYYLSLAVSAGIVLLACIELGRLMKFGLGITFLNLCAFLLGYFYLTPTIAHMFEVKAPAEDFASLHQASVLLSVFSLVSGIFLLFAFLKSVRSEEF